MKFIFYLAIGLIYSASLYAQEPADLYHVELIIFKQTNADAAIIELKDISRPESENYLQQTTFHLWNIDNNSDIQLLSPRKFLLADEAEYIETSNQYQLLYHVAWSQPPYYREQARYIDILKGPENGLTKGIAWVSYERYFRLRLALQYDPYFSRNPETVDTPETFLIPIQIKRIMSEQKLFYLDHPIIGVLAIISPLSDTAIEELKTERARRHKSNDLCTCDPAVLAEHELEPPADGSVAMLCSCPLSDENLEEMTGECVEYEDGKIYCRQPSSVTADAEEFENSVLWCHCDEAALEQKGITPLVDSDITFLCPCENPIIQ